MDRMERCRQRLNHLLTKPGELTASERLWIQHLEAQLNGL